MMSVEETEIHLRAGRTYGRDATCGPVEKPKVNYHNEASAVKAARIMTEKHAKDMEAYPCAWCDGWHIGRAMTQEEWAEFSS